MRPQASIARTKHAWLVILHLIADESFAAENVLNRLMRSPPLPITFRLAGFDRAVLWIVSAGINRAGETFRKVYRKIGAGS
jgi:hypothetical protein